MRAVFVKKQYAEIDDDGNYKKNSRGGLPPQCVQGKAGKVGKYGYTEQKKERSAAGRPDKKQTEKQQHKRAASASRKSVHNKGEREK